MIAYRPLLDFWFGPDCIDRWRALGALHHPGWRPDSGADDDARTRFGDLVHAMERRWLEPWLAEPHGCLAYVLVADTLPRSFYRGSGRAYALDERAMRAVMGCMLDEIDQRLNLSERAFLYLPLTHAEPSADWAGAQERSVDCYRVLAAESARTQVNDDLRPVFEIFLRSAERHAAIIRRFGRFPHRNAVLNRKTTEDERLYLDDPWGYDFSAPAEAS